MNNLEYSQNEFLMLAECIRDLSDRLCALESKLNDSNKPNTRKAKGFNNDNNVVNFPKKQIESKPEKLFNGYREIDFVRTEDINLDPSRFQYKVFHSKESGSSGSLADIKVFNLNLCGICTVWLDPNDNKIYAINGHNRKNLADRTKQPILPCRFLDVDNAKEARIIGALQNISENSGSLLDAAKFFRESGKSLNDLKNLGLTLKGKVSEDSLKLANLASNLWEDYLTGKLPEDRAVILGNYDHNRQNEIVSITDKMPRLSLENFEELAKMTQNNMVNYQLDLFGNLEINQDEIKKRLSIINAVASDLKKESKLFKGVAKNQDQLKRGNNQIDGLTSSNIADKASLAYELLEQYKYVSGAVADLINKSVNMSKTAAIHWLKTELLQLANDFNPSLL